MRSSRSSRSRRLAKAVAVRTIGAMTDPDRQLQIRSSDRRMLEEQLVAPAARGIRKAGIGVGAVVAGGVGLMGLGAASLGGLLLVLSSLPVLEGIGTFLLALGLTATAFGGGGLALMRSVNRSADTREVERRLRKLLENEGETTDAEAARRLKVPIESVRAVAERWIASGAIVVDVDEQTGVEHYLAGQRGTAQLPELTAAEHADMRAFDSALEGRDGRAFTTRTIDDVRASRARADQTADDLAAEMVARESAVEEVVSR